MKAASSVIPPPFIQMSIYFTYYAVLCYGYGLCYGSKMPSNLPFS